ncbi:MAG TPA: hypothetical protein VL241_02815 [Gemmatimonadales bacterium]|nr:hypothetical protein [Gemmatimonadales bacterium]
MLRWAFVFLLLALVSALLLNGGPGLARTLFYIFLFMFAASFIAGLLRTRRSTA